MSNPMGSVEIGEEHMYAVLTANTVVALEQVIRDALSADIAFVLALVQGDQISSTVISRGIQIKFGYGLAGYDAAGVHELVTKMNAEVREHGELRLGIPV